MPTFLVREKQLLGGQRPPQDILASQRLAQDPGSASGRLKYPGAASGRLKVGTSKCHTRTFVTHCIENGQGEEFN